MVMLRTRVATRRVALAVVAMALAGLTAVLHGQVPMATDQDAVEALRSRLESSWTAVRLEDGILLVPRVPVTDVGGVELRGPRIAIDGRSVSRTELRDRVGAPADAVIALADLTEGERLAALGLGPAPAATAEVPRRHRDGDWTVSSTRRGGARVRIGGDVVVPEGDHAGDAAVAILGSLIVNGEVGGDAVAVFGDLKLGPSAVVRGNAVAVGGRLERAEGARVLGEVTEVSIGFPEVRIGLPDVAPVHLDVRPGRWLAGVAFAGTTVRMLVFAVMAFLVLLLAPGVVRRVQQEVADEPVRAGTIGLFAMLLLVPALIALCLVLIISIIGIPLLALVPVLLFAGFVAWTIGVVAVTTWVGARVLGGSTGSGAPGFGALALGLALVWGVTVVARLAWWTTGDWSWPVALLALAGVGVEVVVGAVGLGALLLAWSRRSTPQPAPPVPPVPTTA